MQNDDVERMWKEVVLAYLKVPYQHLAEATKKSNKKPLTG
jgi:hypothetical protein